MLEGRVAYIAAAIIVILGAIGFARRCSDSRRGDLVAEYSKPHGDTLAVAIEMSPLTYTLHNDTAEGFDYQVLRDIAAEHGVPVAFHPFSQLDEAFRGLNDGEYDLVVASLASTNELKKYFPLTDAIYLDKQVLVQRRDSTGHVPVASQEQLLGDTVWVAEGSPSQTRLRNMSHELGESIYVHTLPRYSAEHLAILTALGEVKQSVMNEGIARHIAKDYDNLDISTPISLTQFQCWAVAPGDSVLLDSINTWLGQFKTTRAYNELINKYM